MHRAEIECTQRIKIGALNVEIYRDSKAFSGPTGWNNWRRAAGLDDGPGGESAKYSAFGADAK